MRMELNAHTAKSAIKKQLEDCSKFTYDVNDVAGRAFITNYQKRGKFENWDIVMELMSIMNSNDLIYHEWMPEQMPVKPYLDIEWESSKKNIDPNTVITLLRQQIPTVMQESWGIEITDGDIFISECSRPLPSGAIKYSFHVIVSTHDPVLVFENSVFGKYFAQQVKLAFDRNGLDGSIVDLGVYKRNQNFRLIYNCKIENNIVSQPFVIRTHDVSNPSNEQFRRLQDPKNYIVTYFGDSELQMLPVEEAADQTTYNQFRNQCDAENISSDHQAFVINKVKELLHPTAYIEPNQPHNGFIHFNYTDRNEPCFINPMYKHSKLGFFGYNMPGKGFYVGCFSERCSNSSGKKITRILARLPRPIQEIPQNCRPVSRGETDFDIPIELLSEEIMKECIGLVTIFVEMYSKPQKRIIVFNGNVYYWDGNIWKEDIVNFLYILFPHTLVKVLQQFKTFLENMQESNEFVTIEMDQKKKIGKINEQIKALQTFKFNQSLQKAIQYDFHMPDFGNKRDKHPGFLSIKNGLLNLQTGQVRPRHPDDLCTEFLDIEYDPMADSSNMDQFVREILSDPNGEREELYEFFRWMVGYIVNGDPHRKMFFVFYGPGANNGKSTILNVLSNILDFYASPMDSTVLFGTSKRSIGTATSELCQLDGKRLAMVSDIDSDSKLNNMQIKTLCSGGQDEISVRALYQNASKMKPKFTIIINTNSPFSFDASESALRSRLCAVPFTMSFVENPQHETERPKVSGLEERLVGTESAREGVLKWIVDCCKYYYFANKEWPIPQVIQDENQKYYANSDHTVDFIMQILHHDRRVDSQGQVKKLSLSNLWRLYERFCHRNGDKPIGKKALKSKLNMMQFKVENDTISFARLDEQKQAQILEF